MTSLDTRNAISSPEAAFGPSQLDLLDGLTTNHCGPGVARASRSARPAKVEEQMIQGICGRTFIASSVPEGPLSSWESRLRERLATVGSTESALIWKEKTTPAGRSISRLAVSTRHTNGIGSTGSQWRSPTAGDKRGGAYSDPKKAIARINGTHTVNLEDLMVAQASPWVTPSARDWKDSAGMATEAGDRSRVDQLPRQMAQNASYYPTTTVTDATGRGYQRDKNGNMALPGIMKGYMPTPQARDGMPPHKPEYIAKHKANGHGMANLNDLLALSSETELTGPTPNGSSATTTKRGAPNPVFAFWLMGFTGEWISGALAAMQSYRKPRRK